MAGSSLLSERSALLPQKGRPQFQRQVSCGTPTPTEEHLGSLPVYHTIHKVYDRIYSWVDIPLTEEQMRGPEIQFNIIQPLEIFLTEMDDPSVVYCLFVCRLEFIRQRDTALASSSLNETRAALCEVLAIKLLRHQATLARGSSAGLLAMSRALVGGLHAFQGAGEDVLERVRVKEGYAGRVMAQGAGKTNALELAILSRSRNFIKSQACQRVITAIWEGKVVYSSSSFLDILPDKWKTQEIGLYNLANAPLLDHYRLRVPKYRAMIDFFNFLVLFASFLAVILDRHNRHEHSPVSAMTLHEWWFFIYAVGYSLDKIASVMEHGWTVYSAGLTNGLDALSLPIFLTAFAFRFHSVIYNDPWSADQCFAVLSVAACFMFPRLAFATISNNVLILSLRSMLGQFFFLMSIAVFCFLGFVFALNHLCDNEISVARIGEWLVFIWFGLDGTGIDQSPSFHKLLGPALFIAYAALSNTLLVSLLVAILSDTYSKIAADAVAEDMFRKAVLTFEGVKCDSLFDYVPPLNLVALTIMWPVSRFTSPRWFHKLNVLATRIFSLPILLLIAFYERCTQRGSPLRIEFQRMVLRATLALPNKWAEKISLLEGAHWECEAVFEYTPSGDEGDEGEEGDSFLDLDENDAYAGDNDDGAGVDRADELSEDEVEDLMQDEGATGQPRRKMGSKASAILSRAGRPHLAPSGAHPNGGQRASSYGAAGLYESEGGPPSGSLTPQMASRAASQLNSPEAPTTSSRSRERERELSHNSAAATALSSLASRPLAVPQEAKSSPSRPRQPRKSSQLDLPNTSEDDPSPPTSPRARHPKRASTGSHSQNATAAFPTSRSTRFAQGAAAGHERLPSNATLPGERGAQRRARSPDRGGESALSTSAPTHGGAGRFESPLAKLYQPHESDHVSFGLAGASLGGGGGGAAGVGQSGLARRRTMSMGTRAGGGGLSQSLGPAGAWAGHQAGGGGGGDAEGMRALREMVEGLVGAVARLERRLEEKEEESARRTESPEEDEQGEESFD